MILICQRSKKVIILHNALYILQCRLGLLTSQELLPSFVSFDPTNIGRFLHYLTSDDLWPSYVAFDLMNRWGFLCCIQCGLYTFLPRGFRQLWSGEKIFCHEGGDLEPFCGAFQREVDLLSQFIWEDQTPNTPHIDHTGCTYDTTLIEIHQSM